MKKRIIYDTDDYTDIDKWRKILAEYEEVDSNELSDSEVLQYMYDCAAEYFHDEKANLDMELRGKVIAIADIGRWSGRVPGYRILTSNLNSIFDVGEDYNQWYDNGEDVCLDAVHHDGTNHILFRVLRPNRNPEKFFGLILSGKWSRRQLAYYTESVHKYTKEIYGW